MPFPQTWNALHASLASGVLIKNWTCDSGFLGDDFTVTAVASGFIEVNSPNAANIQRVPREDFELVYTEWANYIAGQTGRAEIRDKTRFSKYIISVLHWLELRSGGRLP